jgi:YD repeat-containing protein
MTPRDLIRLLGIVLALCAGLCAYAEGPTLIAGSASEVVATTSPLTPAPSAVSSCQTYDRYGRVLSAQNPDGTTSYTVYGKQGKPTSVVNALLQATSFDYNTAGQLLRTTSAEGTHGDSTYDNESRVLTRTDRLGRVTTY